jgi:ribosome modulation factor
MTSAYKHGRKAAKHGKHIQACPFDTGTCEWHGWRHGYLDALLCRDASSSPADAEKVNA